MKSPPAEIESPAKAFPAGDPNSGWSYESNVMMPTPMSSAAATILSKASYKIKKSLLDNIINQIQQLSKSESRGFLYNSIPN